VLRRNLQDLLYIGSLRIGRLDGVNPIRDPHFPLFPQNLKNDRGFRIFTMNMRRQMVFRVGNKPDAVKGLRAHAFTLIAPSYVDNQYFFSQNGTSQSSPRQKPKLVPDWVHPAPTAQVHWN
jgi:hypothetical protein